MTRNLVEGAVSGLLATAAFTTVLLAGEHLGLLGEPPPQRITRALLPGPKHRAKRGEHVLSGAAHFAFGGACGALFALAAGRRRRVRVAPGAAYGLLIWAVSYQWWVPALGLHQYAHRDRPGRQAVMAAGHVVYGVSLAFFLNRLRRWFEHEHMAPERARFPEHAAPGGAVR
ncbi:hypothetical protein Ssi03_63110 [Sphaerisporangium siamense]|uniref:Putative membrane protein YagU involved in acid resistance n=1 Tax=Sphaerisporangium siamense TaxID=795645 RepID=A0A7W7D5J7_9ACTN|nr:DUF6789 family protein [Sphaerisporangium siamense]MBB4700516.1 putative membrane protein YagU involved in acid resistance [Sphaerisporangium siamense]GII88321.1 hypothetical protein Ssi03_63110 [Sphaerisporangium siamense]